MLEDPDLLELQGAEKIVVVNDRDSWIQAIDTALSEATVHIPPSFERGIMGCSGLAGGGSESLQNTSRIEPSLFSSSTPEHIKKTCRPYLNLV